MAEQEWVRATVPADAAGALRAARPQRRFELRPLGLGEVLDRTFALYRARFWLFAAIATVAASIYALAQALALANARAFALHPPASRSNDPLQVLLGMRAMGAASVSSYLVTLVFALVASVTFAATARAVTEVYLHGTARAGEVLHTVGRRWYRWIGIQLWQIGSLIWIPICAVIPGIVLLFFGARSNSIGLSAIGGTLVALAFFAGFPVGFILYLRNSLAIPAAVTEGLTARAAMRRSKFLTVGSKGRIFVVLLLAGVLLEIVGLLQLPISLLILFSPSKEHYIARGISLLITFVGQTVVTPFAAIGLTLMYYDQRVRKEAFDLELLLQGAGAPPSAPEPYAALP